MRRSPLRETSHDVLSWSVARVAIVVACVGGCDTSAVTTSGGEALPGNSTMGSGASTAASQSSMGASQSGAGSSMQAAGGSGTVLVGFEPPDDDVPPDECERVESFAAVTISEPAPFDVVIVADHSGSLAWSQDDLAEGLSSLLDQIAGSNIRFFVLTPTQYGASSEQAVILGANEDTIAWRDVVSGLPHENAMTEYSATCTELDGAPRQCPTVRYAQEEYIAHGVWQFRMPEPIAEVTSDMTPEDIAAQQTRISDAILSIGGTGAQREQPVCTLNRYINQARELLPERAVFLVISDEDDTSLSVECQLGHTTTRQRSGTVRASCSSDCEGYSYQMQGRADTVRLEYFCSPVDDQGVSHPELGERRDTPSGTDDYCEHENTEPCTPSDLDKLKVAACDENHEISDCQRTCQSKGAIAACALSVEGDVNACTSPFEHGGVSYDDVLDYCTRRTSSSSDWGGCQRSGYVTQEGTGNFTGSYIPDRFTVGTSNAALVDNFRSLASEVFGEEGHAISLIAYTEEFACEPGPGQSHAAELATLVTSEEHVFPICELYAPVLSTIEGFARELVQTTFPLTLEDDEVVEGVVVTDRVGATRLLAAPDFSYDAERALLVVGAAALSPSDVSLDVDIVAACRRILR